MILLSIILPGPLSTAPSALEVPVTDTSFIGGKDHHRSAKRPPQSVLNLLQQSVSKLYSAPEEVVAISSQAAELAVESGHLGA